MYVIDEEDILAHHGIKGQKWGVRRYQNEDGSLTAEGRERYSQKLTDTKTVRSVSNFFKPINTAVGAAGGTYSGAVLGAQIGAFTGIPLAALGGAAGGALVGTGFSLIENFVNTKIIDAYEKSYTKKLAQSGMYDPFFS